MAPKVTEVLKNINLKPYITEVRRSRRVQHLVHKECIRYYLIDRGYKCVNSPVGMFDKSFCIMHDPFHDIVIQDNGKRLGIEVQCSDMYDEPDWNRYNFLDHETLYMFSTNGLTKTKCMLYEYPSDPYKFIDDELYLKKPPVDYEI